MRDWLCTQYNLIKCLTFFFTISFMRKYECSFSLFPKYVSFRKSVENIWKNWNFEETNRVLAIIQVNHQNHLQHPESKKKIWEPPELKLT